MIDNVTPTQNRTQEIFFRPIPSKTRTRKDPEDCFLSFIDQGTDGYSGCKLVRASPQKTTDIHFIVRTFKAEVRSYRRNYSHRSVALFKTKAGGAKRSNIAYLTGSFLELDGSTDNTIKSLEDVLDLVEKTNLPYAAYVIPTSSGHFHVIWIYDDPLPWTKSGESFWLSQQTRLVQLFKQAGFLVDKGASMNPTQNLRNPSQLHAYNFKRGCEVHIYKSYRKTSLTAIFRALNATNIPNPRKVPASVKLRSDLRANESFITTHKQLGIKLGLSERTVRTEINKALRDGDIEIVQRVGNNKRISRATEYHSNLYIQPSFQNGKTSINTNNSLEKTDSLSDFQANGAEKGRRNKTIFALGLEIKSQLGKEACIESVRAELEGGAMACRFPRREFGRTLKNIMKPVYRFPLSRAKLKDWGLLGPEHRRKSFLH